MMCTRDTKEEEGATATTAYVVLPQLSAAIAGGEAQAGRHRTLARGTLLHTDSSFAATVQAGLSRSTVSLSAASRHQRWLHPSPRSPHPQAPQGLNSSTPAPSTGAVCMPRCTARCSPRPGKGIFLTHSRLRRAHAVHRPRGATGVRRLLSHASTHVPSIPEPVTELSLLHLPPLLMQMPLLTRKGEKEPCQHCSALPQDTRVP